MVKKAIMLLKLKEEKDTTNASNYRPISLKENRGEILERIINEWLEEHGLLNERQFGFRKRRGCDNKRCIQILTRSGTKD